MILETMTSEERRKAFIADYDELLYQCRKLQRRKNDTINRRIVNYRSKNSNDYILAPIMVYNEYADIPILDYTPICTYVDSRGVKRYYLFIALHEEASEVVELTTHSLKRVRERMPHLPTDFDILAAWVFEQICMSPIMPPFGKVWRNPDGKGSDVMIIFSGLLISQANEDDSRDCVFKVMTFLSHDDAKESSKYKAVSGTFSMHKYSEMFKETGFICNESKQSRAAYYKVMKNYIDRL